MSDKAFNSVWDAIEDDPAVAENMKHRSALMMAISEHIKAKDLSQTEAAKMFGVSQPRISDLIRGKIGLFSIDTLVGMLAAAGISVDMRVRTHPAPRVVPTLSTGAFAPKVHQVVRTRTTGSAVGLSIAASAGRLGRAAYKTGNTKAVAPRRSR